MDVIEREELKKSYPVLIQSIQAKHEMGPEIFEELFKNNKPVRGLCTQRRYFVLIGDMCIAYDMDHIITNPTLGEIGRSLQRVIIYANYQEYESARVLQMSSSKHQTGLNFN